MGFEFSTAGRILFGPGTLVEIRGALAVLGVRRLLIVHGANAARAKPLLDMASAAGVDWAPFPVACEPTTSLVAEGVRLVRETQRDGLIGFGGGSVIDTAKAIAGLATNPGELIDYLEVIGGDVRSKNRHCPGLRSPPPRAPARK